MAVYEFSPWVLKVLSNVLQLIPTRVNDAHELYDCWRAAMGKICTVDSFYVGYFHEDHTIAFPYTFDGATYVRPDRHTYARNGVAAWILAHQRPYVYAVDNGLRLNRGTAFGDTGRPSKDAVTVPVYEKGDRSATIVGVASMLSYRPGSYAEEHVRAFEWTAMVVAAAMGRSREDVFGLRALAETAGIPLPGTGPVTEVVDRAILQLSELERRIEPLTSETPLPYLERRRLAREAREYCKRAQTETMQFLSRPSFDVEALLRKLTKREREIAFMLGDLSNKEIAQRLFLTEATVKKHVSHILGKFGVRQRAAVAAKLRLLR